ncbi:MAG TPA: EthD domain-containing protein [Sphingomicrobium sp.]|jgi:hypothetical protein
MIDVRPKVIAAVRRRPGMTHAEFIRYIVDVHAPLSVADPNLLQRYVQNHVFDGAFGSTGDAAHQATFHRDSVTELFYASFEEMGRGFASEHVRSVIAPDGANFADLATSETMVTWESVVQQAELTGHESKIMHFLAAADAPRAQAAWREAHEQALTAAPGFAGALRGVIRSDVLPAAGGATGAHFGGHAPPPTALVASLWVPDGAIGLFRDYEAAVMADAAFDHHRSYFLFTCEREIYRAPGWATA